MNAWRFALAAWCLLTGSVVAGPLKNIDANEAGARYGQARGAAEVCAGVKVGKIAEALKARFHGVDLERFNKQAEIVFSSWVKVKNCVRPADPNPCRIMIQMSCESALVEIGPNGSAEANLLETTGR